MLALVHATGKLPYYFQAHTVYVLTGYPLQSLLKRFDFTGRIAKWGTQLGAFNIRCRPWNSVKGKVLTDFIAEFSPRDEEEMVCQMGCCLWRVFVDGTSNAMRAGARIVIVTPEGIQLEHSFRLGSRASNNEAKYKALLVRLKTVLGMGARDVEAYLDSRLVVNQVQGSFKAHDSQMKEYLRVLKQVMGKFCTVKVVQVARGQNRHANSLATLGSAMTEDVPRIIKVELITEPSINTVTDVGVVEINVTAVSTAKPYWMDSIVDFLAEDRIPNGEKKASKVCRVASHYWLSADKKLY